MDGIIESILHVLVQSGPSCVEVAVASYEIQRVSRVDFDGVGMRVPIVAVAVMKLKPIRAGVIIVPIRAFFDVHVSRLEPEHHLPQKR